MASWVTIANKSSSQNFVNNTIKEVKNTVNKKSTDTIKVCDFFHDTDDEFNFNYTDKIFDIKESFKNYLKNYSTPFLNNEKIFSKRNLHDYIVYNSKNYYDTSETTHNKNDIILQNWNEEDSSDVDSVD